MSTTLSQAISLVRSRHPAFVKQLVPDKALADFFTTEQRRVLTLALTKDRTYSAQNLSITNLTTNMTAGIVIDPFHSVLGGTVIGADPSQPFSVALKLIPYSERLYPRVWPAAFLLNQTLYLCGSATDWTDENSNSYSISLQYVPIPAAFAQLTDTFTLPDTALQVLVARGGLFAASRVNALSDAPPVDASSLASEAAEAEKTFLDTLSLTSRARVVRMRPQRF